MATFPTDAGVGYESGATSSLEAGRSNPWEEGTHAKSHCPRPQLAYRRADAPRQHGGLMSDDRPKSAFELAMERLRQKDKEASIEDRPLTDEQKAAIAEARQFYKAKVAEREILHQAALRAAGTHEEIERLNEELRRDQERLANDRDRKIAEIRREKSS